MRRRAKPFKRTSKNEGIITPGTGIKELMEKYGNDRNVLDKIMEKIEKQQRSINKQAKKMAAIINNKYGSGQMTYHQILTKMQKYKKDNGWSDYEYDLFVRELGKILRNERGNTVVELHTFQKNSLIYRLLGVPLEVGTFASGLRIEPDEQKILNNILKLYKTTEQLSRSVALQTVSYADCDISALTGAYTKGIDNPINHIPPFLAAMFIPKITIFESTMLMSNFGKLISDRNESKPLNPYNKELYLNITTDPNDMVCEMGSPVTDLRNRYRVQVRLWENIIRLRNGSYYESPSINEFITTLNACRNNLFDSADLAFMQDDGNLLRRLLNVFSMRPTIIAIKTITAFPQFGQYGENTTVTRVPMINLNLPAGKSKVFGVTVGTEAKALNLQTSLTTQIWVQEKGTLVPKEQTPIATSEVLIFYLNRTRKAISYQIGELSVDKLPLTMFNFETTNLMPIEAPQTIDLNGETLALRSVVASTTTKDNVVTGSVALFNKASTAISFSGGESYIYDPVGAAIPIPMQGAPSLCDMDLNKIIDNLPPSRLNNQDAYAILLGQYGISYDEYLKFDASITGTNEEKIEKIKQWLRSHSNLYKQGYITNKPISIIPLHSLEPNSLSFFSKASTHGTLFFYVKSKSYTGELLF